jgi:hypothetical protein
MRNCDHRSWLSFHGEGHDMFRCASTMSDIVASLDSPAKKFPSLIVLIGRMGNSSLMSHMLPSPRKRADGQEPNGLCLQLDPGSAFSDHPIFLAHDNILKRTAFTSEPIAPACHRHTIRQLQWPVSSPARTVDSLYNKVIRPFADLVCFFSTSNDDIHSHVEQMVPWLEQSDTWKFRSSFCPRLLLIAAPSEERSAADVQAQLIRLLQQKVQQPRINFHSYVSVYVQNGSNQILQDRVRRECDMARNFRVRKHIVLNAIHFDLLFRHACDHFVRTIQEPFDMLAASRLHRPVPADLQACLTDLLTTVNTYEDMTAFAAPFIARCLTLDNYAYDVPCQCYLCHQVLSC